MADIQASTTTELTVNNSRAWRASDVGASGGIDADMIAGYNIEFMHVTQRLKGLNLRSNSSFLSGTFYPMIISGLSTADNTAEIDIRRTSVHQDGSSFGAYFGTFRYRAGGYNFWEMKENWGSGNRYPFVANFAVASDNKAAVWLRGNCTYFYTFNTNDSLFDVTPNSNKAFGGTTVSPTTTVSLPSSATLYQHNLCSQGYSLGLSSFRWGTVFTVNAINTSSDRRFKENIKDLEIGLEFVKKLAPKSYKLKPLPHYAKEIVDNLDTRRHHGLVAQDVKQAMNVCGIKEKQFTGFNGSNSDHYSLRYDEFVPVMVNAVQEQFKKLDAIEERLKRLEG
jgi:hypothetical protein